MFEYEIMIKNLEYRVIELEKRTQCGGGSTLTVRKWQPKGGDWVIDIDGRIMESVSDEIIISFGVVRQTKEQAKHAAVEMRRFNRLLALRDELCGDAVANWTDNESNKWILYFDNKDNEWTTGKNQYMQYVGVYFANEASAQKACDMLNSGEVEL
jgi:hypothetical protein